MSYIDRKLEKQAGFAIMYGSNGSISKVPYIAGYRKTGVKGTWYATSDKDRNETPFQALSALLTAAGGKYKARDYQERLRTIEPVLKALRELDKRGEL